MWWFLWPLRQWPRETPSIYSGWPVTLSSSRRTRVTSAFLPFSLSNRKRKNKTKRKPKKVLSIWSSFIDTTDPAQFCCCCCGGWVLFRRTSHTPPCRYGHDSRDRYVIVCVCVCRFFLFFSRRKRICFFFLLIFRPTEKLVNQFRYASHPGGVAEYFFKL